MSTSTRIRLALIVFILISFGMGIYEWTKTVFFPNLTLWESHLITIFLSGIFGAVAAYSLYGELTEASKELIGKTRIRLSIIAFTLVTLGMAAYEWTKTLFYPDLTLWESHFITIFFSGISGAVAAYFLYGGLNPESKEDMGKIRTKIFTPILLAILALVGVSSISNYMFVKQISETEHIQTMEEIKDLYYLEIDEDSKSFISMTHFISVNKELQQSFKDKDRQKLLSLTAPIYKDLNKKYHITHFYFLDTAKTCFLRVHKPESHGDIITRNTLKRAEQEGKPASGIELGQYGTLTLRTVSPWYINGELAGYIELGMEVNEIVEEVKDLFGVELFVIIQKEFLDKEKWEKGISMLNYKAEWDRFSNFVIINNNLERIPAEIQRHFNEGVLADYVHPMTGKTNTSYTAGHFPIIDDRGDMVGFLYFIEDEQETHLIMSHMMIFQILLIITIGLLLAITLFLFITRIETKLSQTQKQLIENQKLLEQRVEEEVEKLRQNEQALMHQSKLAAMGEMIGAISHQWRQPLNNLGLFIQGIDDAYEYDELNKEFIDETIQKSMEQINYMSSTIDDFRNFFKQSKEKSNFRLSDAIKDIASLTSAELEGHFIELVFLHDEEKEQLTVYGYLNEFKQVLLNMVSNSKDAIVEKHKKMQNKEAENGKIIIKISRERDCILLEIADNGGGIPEHLFDRIFEPYFSTKEEGKGSGIGLYMAKTIIEQNMKGKLHARNSHEGAVFTIEIEPHTVAPSEISEST